ncbi:MAG: hypothetical protein A3C93_06325 [Candidatus Lloydbacteria bacterium RIFCSPHIGHO2_02_FULL_54_17]|uniref:FCP1 homology domain-containing protein n=1 Tax=Candidatus Lloydbacteria bacterium RIFCSPHIGHO2_02_FULL_54_17 TaxID=1798664 RepID=A0A1G2DGQ4_9BACT|nr:MAG: hypothetical protein A2762_01350 [Candidatus Lloydbacteria bacterium RIFCSPHIGHO2_01_FULL_54_11]OGZ12693.1 MAG: hypothetical protein A3C93_06325 [Candidatus Lloydbacteria bacterium RIFCSPHIGHO2_02_FULL_54_17]OGZ13545.1 MAG: hypothetical protein A2948_04990 [Candidatus Lloydbacteria bacterium RIFCSPLOWO2_01_FULL_54_18]OGZ16215.1 MAG: hypothetical protein A3H76_03820 [Candidatus Lloydbacteria bacterium RIFCSPLOWO2_02_FULL_54_12]
MTTNAERPVLFLDFDRTLFDTARLRDWLGEDIMGRIQAIEDGALEFPDLPSLLYPDTVPFLGEAKKTHRLVLLTTTAHRIFQEKKVYGSGIASHLDDILIAKSSEGSSGKGVAAKEYLGREVRTGDGHLFVDDLPENISEMKMFVPEIRSIQIERDPSRADELLAETLLPPDAKVTHLFALLPLLSAAPATSPKGEAL